MKKKYRIKIKKKKKLIYKINLKKNIKYTKYIYLVYINSTFNNTIINLTDFKGNTIYCLSSGQIDNFKGSKRSTAYAGERVGQEIGKKIKQLGIKKVYVLLKGLGKGRRPSIKGLKSYGTNIILIKDITPIPYNGCRLKKKRR